jgi:uncharacterized integral membrane protein (TIGR00697 family)
VTNETSRTGVYDVVVASFCSLLLVSNVGATKLIQIGPEWAPGGVPLLPIVADGGAFLFPLTYVLGDVLAEVYGMRRARRAIVLGFVLSIIASAVFLAVDAAPPAADWPNQEAWHAVLGFVPRIVAASLAGYLVGQLLNAYVVVRMRDSARPGRLWTRLLGSTIVGEFADTVIFCTLAFAFVVPGATLLNYIAYGYVYKVLLEAVMLPVTVRVIGWVRGREGTDRVPAGSSSVH